MHACGSKHARRCIKVLRLVGLTSLSSICWSSEATCLDVLFAPVQPAGMPAMLMRSTAVPRGSLARDQNPTWRTTLRWLHAGDRCKPRPRALRQCQTGLQSCAATPSRGLNVGTGKVKVSNPLSASGSRWGGAPSSICRKIGELVSLARTHPVWRR